MTKNQTCGARVCIDGTGMVEVSTLGAQAIPFRRNRIVRIGLFLVSFAVLQVGMFAQEVATVTGVLTDPSGAGIANATPTLTNQETGIVLTAGKSDSGGNFSFQAVPAPGAYSLTVDVPGF